jgi:hypothetical protein
MAPQAIDFKGFLFSFKINNLRKIMGKIKPGFTGLCQGFYFAINASFS